MSRRGFFVMLLTLLCSLQAGAAERLLAEFNLNQGEKIVNQGADIIVGKAHSWSNGMRRSYLKVRCTELSAGKVSKAYSTEDHFNGVKILFKPMEDSIQVSVTLTTVKPRLQEIRKLQTNECKNLEPVVTSTTAEYRISSNNRQTQSFEFAEGIKFNIKLSAI